jgi:hypothetical protein
MLMRMALPSFLDIKGAQCASRSSAPAKDALQRAIDPPHLPVLVGIATAYCRTPRLARILHEVAEGKPPPKGGAIAAVPMRAIDDAHACGQSSSALPMLFQARTHAFRGSAMYGRVLKMNEQDRDTEILPIIERAMPDATHEEKLQATFELWEFFDAIWAIADRLVTEEEARLARDKSSRLDKLELPPNI